MIHPGIRRLVGAALLTASSCTCAGMAGPISEGVKVEGQVADDFCGALAGATVAVLGGRAAATTDADGHFTLRGVPPDAVLQVTAPAHKTTLSAHRAFAADATGVEVYSLPTMAADLAVSLSGVPAGRGQVAVLVADRADVPIDGATVDLLDAQSRAPVAATRRYVSLGQPLVRLDAATAQTQARVGAVLFFDVPPGEYLVVAARAGYTFPELRFTVVAGALSGDVLLGEGSGGAPMALPGTVTAFPVWPRLGQAAPLEGATVEVRVASDGSLTQATTDASGRYEVPLPFSRRMVDVTVRKAGYLPWRLCELCLGRYTSADFTGLSDAFWTRESALPALAGKAPQPGTGMVFAAPVHGSALLEGITVSLDPPVVPPYYGGPKYGPCEVGSCAAPGSSCPSGARCESGACLVGAAPACRACVVLAPGNYQCAPAQQLWFGAGPQDGGTECRCVESRTDCYAPSPDCGAGSQCVIGLQSDVPNATWSVGYQACVPAAPVRSATVAEVGNGSGGAWFVNVPPGDYLVRAEGPGRTFPPLPIRVDADVFVSATLSSEQ